MMKKYIFIVSIFIVLTVFFWLGFSSLANPFEITISGKDKIGTQNIMLTPGDTKTLQVKMLGNSNGEVLYTFPSEIFRNPTFQLSYLARNQYNPPSCSVNNTNITCKGLSKGDSVILSAKVLQEPSSPNYYTLPLRVRSIDVTGRKSTKYTTLNWTIPSQYTPEIAVIRPHK